MTYTNEKQDYYSLYAASVLAHVGADTQADIEKKKELFALAYENFKICKEKTTDSIANKYAAIIFQTRTAKYLYDFGAITKDELMSNYNELEDLEKVLEEKAKDEPYYSNMLMNVKVIIEKFKKVL
jgi:pyruvoyl-dependent arginine decarboxylase (PvlArgDC)